MNIPTTLANTQSQPYTCVCKDPLMDHYPYKNCAYPNR